MLVVATLALLSGCNTPDTVPLGAYVPTGIVNLDGVGTDPIALEIPRAGHNITVEHAFRAALANLHYAVVPSAPTTLVINVIKVKNDDHSPPYSSADEYADGIVTIDVHVRAAGVDGPEHRFTSWHTCNMGQILIAGAYQAAMTDAVSDVVDEALSDPGISASLHNALGALR